MYDQELGNIYEDEIAPISNVDLYDGIIDWGEANIDSDSVYKILNFGAGTDYWLMEEFASGGVCYPTAATNILWYWGVKRNRSSVMDKVASKTTDFQKAKAIFDIMHDKMGTSETSTWDIMVSSVRMLGNEVYGLLQKLETTHRSAHIKAPWTCLLYTSDAADEQ